MSTLYCPEMLHHHGNFHAHVGLLVDERGQVEAIVSDVNHYPEAKTVNMPGKALLPGFVNAHSHSFQRLIRGKSESRLSSGPDFWSWRNTMYRAANSLSPAGVYDVARMAFLEMLLAGTTTVGEFHYLHNDPDGKPYDDPNLLSKQVIAAAQSVGIRIVLLRTAYLRSGHGLPLDDHQIRFFETTQKFIHHSEALIKANAGGQPSCRIALAPHSIRAVPLGDLKEIAAWAAAKMVPLHMHVSEQLAENSACLKEHGLSPVRLLAREKVLSPAFTAIHAIHLDDDELGMLAETNASICSCPTTERNLGDGVFASDRALKRGIRVALGSDSQAQIDPLEDARELDYHLRLKYRERALLDQIDGKSLAVRLFECATTSGAASLGIETGDLVPGSLADFVTIDLRDVSITGHTAEDLLSIVVFSLKPSAVRDVVVGGELVIDDRKHPLEQEIVDRYRELHTSVWRNEPSYGGMA